MIEQWIPIYNNLYSVSNLGNVKANERDVETKTGIRHYKEKILKPEITRDGHLRVVLCEAGKSKRVLVHRLVAQAFIDNPYNLPQVNHIDGDKSNNSIDNLEWCTREDNIKHAYKIGLNPSRKKIIEYIDSLEDRIVKLEKIIESMSYEVE